MDNKHGQHIMDDTSSWISQPVVSSHIVSHDIALVVAREQAYGARTTTMCYPLLRASFLYNITDVTSYPGASPELMHYISFQALEVRFFLKSVVFAG